MKTQNRLTTAQSRNIVRLAVIVGMMLMIPLVAMRFTTEVDWTLFDFIFAGTLLFGTGLAYTLISQKSQILVYRAGLGLAVATCFLLVWVNAAVGIIGDDNPANILFLGIPLIGLIGSAVARFEPRGMMRAAVAAAISQALVPIVALFVWTPQTASWAPGVVPVFVLNSVFVMLFVGAALLFREAGKQKFK